MVHARSSVVYQAPTGIGTIAAAYSPDGQQVAVASGDGIVRIFDVSEGFEIRQLECPTHPDLGSSLMGMLSYDPSGHWIAACSNPDNRSPGEVRVFDVTACQRVFTLRGHGRPVTCVAFSPDGRRIASGSLDQTVKLWETETGQEVFTLRGHTGGVISVAFSRDGRQIATGAIDCTVKIWDTAAQQDRPRR